MANIHIFPYQYPWEFPLNLFFIGGFSIAIVLITYGVYGLNKMAVKRILDEAFNKEAGK